MCWLVQALPANSTHDTKNAISSNATSSNVTSSDTGIISGKHFDRVFIIVFENKDYSTAMKDKYLKTLPQRHNGVLLTNYRGTSHPSQPNYIAMTSGSTKGTKEDDESNIKRKNIVDLLEAKNISWKSYQEDYPGGCNKEMDIDNYARKHNPFMSYTNVQKNKKRCAKIVNAKELDKDIKKGQVPQYVFYTPDIRNDAHDTKLSYGTRWLKKFLEPKLKDAHLTKKTMFVVTFDEDDSNTKKNQVYTALFGPDFKRSSKSRKDHKKYDHYSLLKTIEDNWDLGDLGQKDKDAVAFDL
ncbi:phosphoesterase family-domain-containing protein [Syncephalastrum racemosum]|uniref:Phosphoesterase family-domain-containing protein n=1 Tax=Syncephalastrum racemosum TaxID=13706 RepID=A0A1X2HSB3_SYNRA|nr:phosphoesterase family-domain-containing protein [Syncephalastrum racemosum]